MARIAGVDIPNAKRVEIGLTYIFGIGRTTSNQILAKTGIDPDTRCKDLTEEEIAKRRETFVLPEPKEKTGYLSRYAKLVTSANTGAVLSTD